MPPLNEIRFYSRTKAYSEFSNFYYVQLHLDGKEWASVEHYYQAMKSTDPDEQEDIRMGYVLGTTAQIKAGTVKAGDVERDLKAGFSKKQGKLVKLREDWDVVKDDVMRKALLEKYSENNPELRALLLSTGDAILIEASPTDYYWGEGAAKIGKNMLGVLLMDLRWKFSLQRGGVYLLISGEEVVFKHISQTGAVVCMPIGEPSFEDCFILKEPKKYIEKYVRPSTPFERGED